MSMLGSKGTEKNKGIKYVKISCIHVTGVDDTSPTYLKEMSGKVWHEGCIILKVSSKEDGEIFDIGKG